MAYNPYGGGGPGYGHPPGPYDGFQTPPGNASMGAPPGMAPPPGMSAPGTALPPGMQQANNAPSGRPGGMPPNFQNTPNMPNINFSAPVIRLGTTGPMKPGTPSLGPDRRDSGPGMGGGPRMGLGAERGLDPQRMGMRENLMSLVPPTKDEIVRTVFVGGITEGVGGNSGVERVLSTAGRLRRWDRAADATGKPCSFGFAQFEDPESLAVAVEVLKDLEVPLKRQIVKDEVKKEPDQEDEDAAMADIEKAKLLVFVDDNSLNYLDDWRANRGDDAAAEQARLDTARQELKMALHELFHPPSQIKTEADGEDTRMQDADANGDNVEVVNIPLAAEDELADIPAEMREIVAQEIAAFRDRSNRRDIERLKREEEMEAAERARNGAPRTSRLDSPGPANSNQVPLGPRGVPNAPSGPRHTGVQLPRDYQQGVKFINGGGNGAADGISINPEDDDSDASDDELERRRTAKRQEDMEKQYLDQERRWLNRERSRTAAVQREKEREEEEQAKSVTQREKMAKRLKDWDEDAEASRKSDDYYIDRSAWVLDRAAFRAREAATDERDRMDEAHEHRREASNRAQARGMAESFLDRQAEELVSQPPRMSSISQQPFKLSLGAAAQRAQKAAPARRTVAEVEGLLEDEGESADTAKRTLIPIKFDATADAAGGAGHMTDEERDQAVRQLAAEIPTERDGLWAWRVQWDFLDDALIADKLRPFVERKIVEYLGVQEQLLVEVVEEHVRRREGPQGLVEQLEGALDEEAEVLVKKLWRMVIFFSESEKRGLA